MSADIRAGRAFVELYLQDLALRAGLSRSRRHLLDFARDVARILNPTTWIKAFGNAMAGLGQRLATVGAAAGVAFVPAVKAAMDAQETMSKFQAVFGSQSAAVGDYIDDLSKRVGRSATGIRDSLSAYQAFFVGLGFGADEASKMSREMAALGIDLGSFFNKSDAESNQRFLSALSGSSEVLDQFGINIKQAALEAELAAMGVNKAWVDVTEPEKVLARLSIIRKSMAAQGAIGDAERTSSSAANQWKKIQGLFLDLSAAVGKALLPVLAPLAQRISEILGRLTAWADRNPQLIASIGDFVVKLTLTGAAMFAVGKGLAIFGGLMGLVGQFVFWTTVLTIVVPLLLKFAAAVKLGTIAVAGLKLALTTFGPFLLKTTLMLGGLTLGLTALAATFINAKAQGISFGESVLDLGHKLTGLESDFTRLRSLEEFQREGNKALQAYGRATGAIKPTAPEKRVAQMTPEERQRHDAEQNARSVIAAMNARRRELASQGQAIQEKWDGRTPFTPWDAANKARDAEKLGEINREMKGLNLEIARQQKLLAQYKRPPGGTFAGFFGDLPARALEAGREAGSRFARGFQAIVSSTRFVAEGLQDLYRARAESIEDPMRRELAQVTLDFDRRMGEATAQGLPTGVLRETRAQEEANIRARYARDTAAKNAELDYDVRRAEIEARHAGKKDSREKDLELLAVDREKAIADARKGGLDVSQVERLFALREQLLTNVPAGMQRTSVAVGGVAATAMAGGGGGTPAERTARATESALRKFDKLQKENERIVAELRNLEPGNRVS